MLKKLLIASAAVVVGLLIVNKTQLGSLLQVWCKDASHWASRQVSPETRIKQLKLEVKKIDDDIKKAADQLITVELDRKDLKSDLESLKARQAQRKTEMTALLDGLEKATARVSFNDQVYSADAAQWKLDGLTAEFEIGQKALKAKEELLRNKDALYDTTDQRILAIRAKKEELQALVGQLETQLELVRLKQVENQIHVSDSQASKADALAQDIKRMLAEETIRAETYGRYGLNPASPKTVKEEKSKAESVKAARKALANEEAETK
jgi:chromosome segregation ATPase